MRDFLLFICIIFPMLMGCIVFFDKSNAFQRIFVSFSGVVLSLAALWLCCYAPAVSLAGEWPASSFAKPIMVLDFALLCILVLIGFRRKHPLILGLAAIQLCGMILLEFWHDAHIKEADPAFVLDGLSVTLVLIISLVGSVVAQYALGYMKEHEAHLHLDVSRRPRFFALILIFLGAMNGLVLADNLTWLYFFWEITTLCSYLLIGHDQTEEANNNACRALWMNLAGGVAFVCALLYLVQATGTLSLKELITFNAATTAKPVIVLIPVVMLCFASFTKSAQIPFQSWLCGAMVAPTPVSALLHSSTMVNAGVYLLLRMAPIYAGTAVSSVIAVIGAFTFIATAALAVGQSNGKKILAYSTISNLGLIIACAGINTEASLAAGMMLLIFHAVSKGLLFMCVGSIEQKIVSRDIEDMRGLFTIMPRTALIMTIGIMSMILPPFGVLLAKWMAIESAVEARMAMPFIVAMLALGSGLTVLYWARWAGIMLGSASPILEVPREEQDRDIRKPLVIMCAATVILSFFSPILYKWLIAPVIVADAAASGIFYSAERGGIMNSYGVFAVYPIFILIGLGVWYAWREAKKSTRAGASLPYMSGQQAEENGSAGFIGPMNTFVEPTYGNYYPTYFFGEEKITRTANTVALVLIFMLVGGVLQ